MELLESSSRLTFVLSTNCPDLGLDHYKDLHVAMWAADRIRAQGYWVEVHAMHLLHIKTLLCHMDASSKPGRSYASSPYQGKEATMPNQNNDEFKPRPSEQEDPQRKHVSHEAHIRGIVMPVLIKNDGRCMDDETDREELCKAIVAALLA